MIPCINRYLLPKTTIPRLNGLSDTQLCEKKRCVETNFVEYTYLWAINRFKSVTMKRTIGYFFVLFVLLLSGQTLLAQGNLLVAPIRVVFEDGKQREDLNLSNIGQDTAVYLISFLQYEMKEDGRFLDVTDSATQPTPRADNFLRVFPRRVTLPPGESQIVRLQYRKPQNLADGEYRSHLYFRADKNSAPLGMEEGRDTTRLSVSITPIFGISIPIIVRNGRLSLNVSLSDLTVSQVNDTIYSLNVAINRSGNQSAYGTLEATYESPQGDKVLLGLANGVGVYTELNRRIYNLPLRVPRGLNLKAGKLVVRFLTPRDAGATELARSEYRMP